MKMRIFGLFSLSLMLFACKKSDPDPVPAAPTPYMSTSANSTWQYEQITNPTGPGTVTTNYTLTSTNRDSTINGKPYHVYTNSNGNASEYYNITGSDYYQYRSLPAALGGTKIDALYLKDNLATGGSWTQNVNITISGVNVALILTNNITEKGVTKTVNGINYTDVITVTTTITPNTPGIPASAITSDIKSYYARKVGLIQNDTKVVVNFMGFNQTTDNQTKLKSSDIK
jgi:hypothetical protein